MGYLNVTDGSPYELKLSRKKALELIPELRKRDEGAEVVRIDPRTIKLKRKKK